MDVYRHVEGREEPEIVEVIDASVLVRELRVGDGGSIWIEEQEDEVDLDISLQVAGIGHRHHVHHGRCRQISVEVQFNGEKTEVFRPLTSIRQIFEVVTGPEPRGFNLTPEQRAKHVLALPDADHFLGWNVRIGTLVTPGTCSVVLQLLPKERFEG